MKKGARQNRVVKAGREGAVDENTQKEKQKRSAPFSQFETDLLLQLVLKYRLAIVDTNALTQHGRTSAWAKLTTEFNSSANVKVYIFFLIFLFLFVPLVLYVFFLFFF